MDNKPGYNPKIHNRQTLRLKGYDYGKAGLYFITVCCQDRACLFGDVVNGEMVLNDAGKMVEKNWLILPARFKNIELHEYIVMPNHFHSILEIVRPNSDGTTVGATIVVAPSDEMDDDIGQPQGIAPTNGITPTNGNSPTLGHIMGAFQSIVTVEYIRGVKKFGWQSFNGKLWQRNYYERIIRSEKAYNNISNYIRNNPAKWDSDDFYRK